MGFSLIMASGFLSDRSPRKTEWRMWPSRVHSPKETSATSSGETQCAFLSIPAAFTKGQWLVPTASSLVLRLFSDFSVKAGTHVSRILKGFVFVIIAKQ